jgi:hypothetical protein
VITRPCLCTREDVARAADQRSTIRDWGQVDRAVESARTTVEELCHRTFIPWTGTRYKDWPPEGGIGRSWRLWLDRDELVSVATITSGGVTIPATDYFLEPANSGPPYNRIEIDLSSSAAWGGGDTHQRDVAISGVWGNTSTWAAAGTLAEALDASETGVDVSNSTLIGVGDLIAADSEWMTVSDRAMLDTGINLAADLTANTANVTVQTSGAGLNVGETILIDSERMLITDLAGTTATVKRAWDGTVLAAHTGTLDIYAPRSLTVVRGAQGTTAATHSSGAAVTRHVVPPLARDLAVAEAIVRLAQEGAAYARTVGSGESLRNASGAGLKALRDDVYTAHGRKARIRSV